VKKKPRVALCLPGGGVTGAMFQIGALAALEDSLEDVQVNEFDVYIGSSSGASVAAALAGGRPVQRIYRSFLDPADQYFPLERAHILKMDLAEWKRMVGSGMRALRQGSRDLLASARPSPSALWEELARLYDSLPAGLFHLETYERFLADFFSRRGVPNSFKLLPRELLIMAHDLDSGQPVLFGYKGFEHVPISRACIASMAIPPFFSPVRIGDRHYIDAGIGRVSHLDVAVQRGAQVILLVNPMVPVRADRFPTGHGERPSIRHKGSMWVANQANRIVTHAHLHQAINRVRNDGDAEVIVIEPDPTDAILFMHNPASFGARRSILEYAYRTTRERVNDWLEEGRSSVRRAGWRKRVEETS